MSVGVAAEIDWVSLTVDNDVLVGNDSGYTNGIYLSVYDVGFEVEALPESDFWVWPLLWSIPEGRVLGGVNAYTVGQAMNTPSDITVAVPDEDDLPYSALLFLNNSYLVANDRYADKISTTIGIVGPAAFGEETQKFVHELIDSDEPKGWDTQLENELVFQLSRARIVRSWVSGSGNADLLSSADLRLGTIESSVNGGLMLRYGRGLVDSFATPLFNDSRTSNPAAIEGGWYIYAGAEAGYMFNQIFTDGNTFRDSRSIDYDRESIGVTMGIAYSWQNCSLTFAVNDLNIIQSGDESEELEDLTRFGTLTFAWRH